MAGRRSLSLSIAALGFFLATLLFSQGIKRSAEKAAKAYLSPPPEKLEWFHFGFRESMADSLWIRWIQDNDTCQTYLSPVKILLDQPVTDLAKQDRASVPRYKICDNSWSFKMLDAVTKLAPKFLIPYVAGGSVLAILVEDFPGASEIYDRGIKEYPNDWQLLYRAAFHYQFNIKDIPRAAELLVRAADHGAPDWVRSQAARLYTSIGQAEMALGVLEQYREAIARDPQYKESAIKSVDARIDELREKLRHLQK